MRTFSHVGIPTEDTHQNERHNVDGGFYVTDFNEASSRIEWLRCEEKCGLPEILQKQTHIAFVVEDIEEAMKGAEVLLDPWYDNDNLRIGFIIEDGAPVELMQYMN